MEQATRPRPYQAFILRCWVEHAGRDEKPIWRFSLEPVAGGKRLGFSNLKTLVSFLKHQTDGESMG